jgi:DNA-binding transcriptional ArsR family regulator
MLARLATGPATVSELARPLKMSLPAVMQHLKALEDSGLIRSEKKGRVRTCRLNPGVLAAAEQWIVDRRSDWEKRHARLEEYVMTLKDKEKEDDRQA